MDCEVGEVVRYYQAGEVAMRWLPGDSTAPPAERDASEEPEEGTLGAGAAEEGTAADRPDYDRAHYLRVFHTSYVARLRKAFRPDDFAQVFRQDGQGGLFDRPLSELEPLWIQVAGDASSSVGPARS